MLWVTRAGGNVDRVACPWLIRRFIDKDAQFLYVPADKVLEAMARGFAMITTDDHQKLEWEFPMYDALYAYCQRKVAA